MSIPNAKYVHTNIVAKDWRKLSRFYRDLFGCIPVPPERHYKGEGIEKGTGVKGTEVHGEHLRLPGFGENGPTLEIFSYSVSAESIIPNVNKPGFAHIAFSVDNVEKAQKAVIKAGGEAVGEIIISQTLTGDKVTWCYVRDIEKNIIELQSWEKA